MMELDELIQIKNLMARCVSKLNELEYHRPLFKSGDDFESAYGSTIRRRLHDIRDLKPSPEMRRERFRVVK